MVLLLIFTAQLFRPLRFVSGSDIGPSPTPISERMDETETSPQLPHFEAGEQKVVSLQFSETDGVIRVAVASAGMDDDINNIALFLSFALEKLLDEASS